MHTSWLSLIPPLVVLLAALMTKRLNSSLVLGIVVAAVIARDGSLFDATSLGFGRLSEQLFNIDKLYLYAFLIAISSFITLLSLTGGAIAFAHIITKRLRSIKMVETSAMLLSSVLFIDDYLSNLTVGYVMRPMTDRFHIPRAKLAFIIHSLSGPLVILAPVSSWVAMISGQIEQAGVNLTPDATTKIIAEPFSLYLQTIPFIFYSLFIIASVWLIVSWKISYGPMHTQEVIAQREHNMFGGKPAPKDRIHTSQTHGSAADLIIPMLVLISCVLLGILYVGGFHLFGGPYGFIQAIQHNNRTEFVLFTAGTITLVVAFGMALVKKTIKPAAIITSFSGGIQLMQSAIIMVILASTLSALLKNDLMTGNYLASLLHGALPIALLPVIFYVIAFIIALVTGSSWSTIALLTSIGVQTLVTLTNATLPASPADLPLLLPILGAIFSGAVCGDHISPISETTIMAATSSGAYPLDHTQTQFWYAVPAIVSSAIAFVVAGYTAHYGITTVLAASITAGMVSCVGMLLAANKWAK